MHRVAPQHAAPNSGQCRVLCRAPEDARGDANQLTGDSALDCARDPQPHPELC